MPSAKPPASLISHIHQDLFDLLRSNPIATASESFVQHYLEFNIIKSLAVNDTSYYLRTGINYHGQKVQHVRLDAESGSLIGWNPRGDALGTGDKAKMLLAGHTIFNRDADEPMMNDMKIGGGDIPAGCYVRVELKARGWLGKTKNLAGAQLVKDIDLLKDGKADLLVVCLSETAHKKWSGLGPAHHVGRRTGLERFSQLLIPTQDLQGTAIVENLIAFEGQAWKVSCRRVIADLDTVMPGAEHYVTLCWKS